MKSLVLAAAVAATLSAGTAMAGDSARYQVQFDLNWTAQTHPLDYPSGAHFSGLVGATTDGSYRLFADGAIATPGLEALSERGAHSPIDQEIKAAIRDGKAGAFFESSPLFSIPGAISTTFTADAKHPFASVAAMIAPSPDWFTGIDKVQLYKDGRWQERISMTLFAWDAGTDNGTTHEAADDDAQPRQSTRVNAAPQFKDDNGLKPVGTVTFTRLRESASK